MIGQTLTNSFKVELLQGVHDFDADTFKIALYTAEASIGAETTIYTTTGEVSGTGYTAGGESMSGVGVAFADSTAYVTFSNVSWSSADFTARGALIYNASKSNAAVAALDFGADKTATTTFTVQMPANNASSALIRIS